MKCPDCRLNVNLKQFGVHASTFCMKISDREEAAAFFSEMIFPILKKLERCEISPNETEEQIESAYRNRGAWKAKRDRDAKAESKKERVH